jgi:predicted nucleic acid-binding protein
MRDPFVENARLFIRGNPEDLIISDFASAEFVSVVGVRMRARELSKAEAVVAFHNFDRWTKQNTVAADMRTEDIEAAVGNLRSLTLALRLPDAIHLAIARRLNATIVTFDKQMVAAARRHRIPVVTL